MIALFQVFLAGFPPGLILGFGIGLILFVIPVFLIHLFALFVIGPLTRMIYFKEKEAFEEDIPGPLIYFAAQMYFNCFDPFFEEMRNHIKLYISEGIKALPKISYYKEMHLRMPTLQTIIPRIRAGFINYKSFSDRGLIMDMLSNISYKKDYQDRRDLEIGHASPPTQLEWFASFRQQGIIFPFYIPAWARVYWEEIRDFLAELAHIDYNDVDAVKQLIEQVGYSNKTTLYYMHEIYYLLFNKQIGPILTPYVLYQLVEEGYNYLKQLREQLIDTCMNNLEFLYSECISDSINIFDFFSKLYGNLMLTLEEQEQIMRKIVIENIDKLYTHYESVYQDIHKLMLEHKDLFITENISLRVFPYLAPVSKKF